tara:strand:+ start:118 stop:393 length:276 start_codon:yes stop_codon:yes gene_type:complete
MSSPIDKLRGTLGELHDELQSLDAVNDDARQMLAGTLQEIESVLQEGTRDDTHQETLLEKLRDSARHLEESHPAFSRTLGGLIDTLSQMGI